MDTYPPFFLSLSLPFFASAPSQLSSFLPLFFCFYLLCSLDLSIFLKLLVLEKFKKLVSPLLILILSSGPLHLMASSLPSQPIKSFPILDLPLPPLLSPILLWKLNITDRLKLFLSKIAWDIIPSKTKINVVFPISTAKLVCSLCNLEEDSLPRLFFRYVFARIAWTSSHWRL